jgi:hypothetical protein
MSLFLGLALIVCVGLAIWGLVHKFPFFIIKGAMINGIGALASLYALYWGVYYGVTRSGWGWLLALLGIGFGWVCGFNLYHYVTGKEARDFNAEVAARIRCY